MSQTTRLNVCAPHTLCASSIKRTLLGDTSHASLLSISLQSPSVTSEGDWQDQHICRWDGRTARGGGGKFSKATTEPGGLCACVHVNLNSSPPTMSRCFLVLFAPSSLVRWHRRCFGSNSKVYTRLTRTDFCGGAQAKSLTLLDTGFQLGHL